MKTKTGIKTVSQLLGCRDSHLKQYTNRIEICVTCVHSEQFQYEYNVNTDRFEWRGLCFREKNLIIGKIINYDDYCSEYHYE